MDKAKALALVQQQRRFWRSKELDDLALARRAERIFFRVAVVYLIIAPIFFGIAYTPKHRLLYAAAGINLFIGVLLFWRSRQFTQALRLLSDSKTGENGMA